MSKQSNAEPIACVRERVKQAILEKMDKAVLSRDASPETQSRHDARFEATAYKYADAAIAAIAQSDAEPVAWRYTWPRQPPLWSITDNLETAKKRKSYGWMVEPLYTAPLRPDASAGLIEAEKIALNTRQKWGSEWDDACVAIAEAIRSRAADRSGK